MKEKEERKRERKKMEEDEEFNEDFCSQSRDRRSLHFVFNRLMACRCLKYCSIITIMAIGAMANGLWH